MAQFQFSQPFFNVSEGSGVVSVCLELVNGILTEGVLIEVVVIARGEDMAGCKLFIVSFTK